MVASIITTEHGVLGKATEYPSAYNRDLLFPIPRAEGRALLGIGQPLPFQGIDRWSAYELSWLNPQGLPQVAIAEFDFPCASPNIVESKSLKLYLNSFNQTVFASVESVQQTMANDLSAVSGSAVTVRLYPVQDFLCAPVTGFQCIDDLDVSCSDYLPNPALLQSGNEIHAQQLCSHLFRSLCPVTGQPDWATLYITYTGKKIQPESLLQYIVSFRHHQGFHEQCVEQIYSDLMHYCELETLTVYGRFLRRGGLDINPFRSSDAWQLSDMRDGRQ
jgi:7-cyano-7-deazaguanine reductase